jgi:hypothetical protein
MVKTKHTSNSNNNNDNEATKDNASIHIWTTKGIWQ